MNVTPRQQLETMCRHVIHAISETLPIKCSITVILADFGDRGNLAYSSNSQRDDMIATLKDMIAHLEGRAVNTKGHG